jgi:hypothetical protein
MPSHRCRWRLLERSSNDSWQANGVGHPVWGDPSRRDPGRDRVPVFVLRAGLAGPCPEPPPARTGALAASGVQEPAMDRRSRQFMGNARHRTDGCQTFRRAARHLHRRQLRRIVVHAVVASGGGAAAPSWRRREQNRGGQSRRRRHRSAQLLLSDPRCGVGAAARRRVALHLCRQRLHGAR